MFLLLSINGYLRPAFKCPTRFFFWLVPTLLVTFKKIKCELTIQSYCTRVASRTTWCQIFFSYATEFTHWIYDQISARLQHRRFLFPRRYFFFFHLANKLCKHFTRKCMRIWYFLNTLHKTCPRDSNRDLKTRLSSWTRNHRN